LWESVDSEPVLREETAWRQLTVEELWPTRGGLDNKLTPFIGMIRQTIKMGLVG
jgi:hypothetical protein